MPIFSVVSQLISKQEMETINWIYFLVLSTKEMKAKLGCVQPMHQEYARSQGHLDKLKS